MRWLMFPPCAQVVSPVAVEVLQALAEPAQRLRDGSTASSRVFVPWRGIRDEREDVCVCVCGGIPNHVMPLW